MKSAEVHAKYVNSVIDWHTMPIDGENGSGWHCNKGDQEIHCAIYKCAIFGINWHRVGPKTAVPIST